MIGLVLRLLLAIPALGELILKIRDEIERQNRTVDHNRNAAGIDDWVRDDEDKPGAGPDSRS
jgi:hypothetical protein